MTTRLTDEQWQQFERDGYLKLGQLLTGDALAALQQRIDDIMLGKADVDYDRMLMQLDADSNDYGKLTPQTKGHKGATLDYRKIQDLEWDPTFLRFMQQPLFKDICERQYGRGEIVRCFRAMFMNKPAGKGTVLPWHQDRWNYLNEDPAITIWLAIDPATVLNGCVRVIPGSHRQLLNPEHSSGFLTKEQGQAAEASGKAIHLELEAGEVVLLHNWTLHASDVNRSKIARRAFSICYMNGTTKVIESGAQPWTTIFGEGALDPEQLQTAKAG